MVVVNTNQFRVIRQSVKKTDPNDARTLALYLSKNMLPEVRMARVLEAIGLHRAGRLSCIEAGELLGLSERHFRRLRDAYQDRGEEGLVDRRRGRVSSTRVSDAEAEWLAEMFRTRYFDFTAKHFHEQIVGRAMADGKPFHRCYSHPRARILGWRHRPVARSTRNRSLPFGRNPERKVEGQERVCRVSPLRGEPVDGVDSFGAKRPEPAHPAHR